jgi:hypothetical protein
MQASLAWKVGEMAQPSTRPIRTLSDPIGRVYWLPSSAIVQASTGTYSSRALRSAAETLKQGDREARFPAGSFPPGLPFVAG